MARLANVSQATVSYALNDRFTVTVPAETRQRILEAAESLGYVPNTAARSLRLDKTFTIATIIPDITNPFYPAFQRGIQDLAEQQGYDLILYNSDGSAEKERAALISVQRRGVDGLIGVFFHVTARDLLPFVEHGHLPWSAWRQSPSRSAQRLWITSLWITGPQCGKQSTS